MTPERWHRVEEAFERAVAAPPSERAAVIAAAVGDDDELCREVTSLIESDDGARARLGRTLASAAGAVVQLAAGTRLGPYRLLRVIGEGGMGTVYLAERDDEFRRRVAIKVVRHGLGSPELVARLRDERQVLATLDHPGIVRLLDGGRTDDGLPYLVMEHVDGVPFTEHVRGLTVRACIELVIGIAEALQHAHQHLIVHRDVKPSNLLVDRNGAPKLLDFGIAKLLDPSGGREAETRTGAAAFTVDYASPEQVRGQPVTVATDVYSLGAVLYHALVGEPPQRAGATPLETLANVCDREPRRPSVIRSELRGDVDNIVLKALHKQPVRRYGSMAALVDDLRRYLAGEPVQARESTLTYRARKFAGRYRGVLAVTALVVGALAAATVISLSAARRADDHAREAERQRRLLLGERGRQELASGHAGRALPYLVEVLREGEDTPALRFLLAEALRPFSRRMATLPAADGVQGIGWSPDGSRLAVVSRSGHVRIYDPSGRAVAGFDQPSACAVGPIFDDAGTRVAIASAEGPVVIADVATGSHRVQLAAPVPVDGAVFVDAGRTLITVGGDGTLASWDTATGARRRAIALGSPSRAIVIAPRSQRLFTGRADGVIEVWDSETGARLGGGVSQTGAVGELAIAPDGEHLYSAEGDDHVHIWDATALTMIATVRGHGPTLDRSGRRLLTAADDGVARIWDARTGALETELIGHDRNQLRTARWSPDGTRVVTAGADGTFRIWDATDGAIEQIVEADGGGGDAPHSLPGAREAYFSPDGNRLLTQSGRSAALWRVDRAPVLEELALGGFQFAAAFSPDDRRLACTGIGVLAIHDVASGHALARVALGDARLWDVSWRPDGGAVLVVGDHGTAHQFAADGAPLGALTGHRDTVNRGAYSPDGRRIVTAADDHTARIWDAATGAELRVLPHPDRVMAAAWTRDGARLATAGWDHHLRVWSADGALQRDLDGATVQYLDVTFSPDGRRLAAAGHGGEIEIWDLASGRRTGALVGHTAAVTSTVWSPDGALLVSSADDATVRIWDPATGALLATRRHRDGVMSAQWSHDGARVVTASIDGRVVIWDARRDRRPAAELVRLIRATVPYRLVAGRVEGS